MDDPTPTSQKAYIRHRLETERAVCGTDLLKAHIPRYSARIAELRAEGMPIVTETCDRPGHQHRTRQSQFRLELDGQRSLFG